MITIVVVLAAAMVPMFKTSRSDAQLARVHSDLDKIKSAVMLYHYDGMGWPPPSSNGSGLMYDYKGDSPYWKGPYLDEWKQDPWGNNYTIDTNWTKGRVCIYSYGPDKTDNDCDAVADIALSITILLPPKAT